jgi:DNA-binding MarR family transcriptional regulator
MPTPSDNSPTVPPMPPAAPDARPSLQEILRQPLRLRLMSVLCALEPDEGMELARLQSSIKGGAPDLAAQVAKLEAAGLVTLEKDVVANRRRTQVRATAAGRAQHAEQVAVIREMMGGLGLVDR